MSLRKLARITLARHLEMLVAYLNNPSKETIFGSNRIKEQHETMKLQNEEVMPSKTFETLINELNRPEVIACIIEKLLRKKAIYIIQLQYSNINIVKVFFAFHNKVPLLTRDVLSREQEIVTKNF